MQKQISTDVTMGKRGEHNSPTISDRRRGGDEGKRVQGFLTVFPLIFEKTSPMQSLARDSGICRVLEYIIPYIIIMTRKS